MSLLEKKTLSFKELVANSVETDTADTRSVNGVKLSLDAFNLLRESADESGRNDPKQWERRKPEFVPA